MKPREVTIGGRIVRNYAYTSVAFQFEEGNKKKEKIKKSKWWDYNQGLFIYFSVANAPDSAVTTEVEQGSSVAHSDSTEKLAKVVNNLSEIWRKKIK